MSGQLRAFLRMDAPRLAAAFVILVMLAGSTARALAVPLFGSADEIGHFDYAYQVWHGKLPDFYQGTVVDQVKGRQIPVQWVSQHPPLFYLILAPVIGPLTDAGHVLIAGMLARGVNMLIGGLAVGAVMFAVARAFPGRRAMALGAGLVTAMSPWMQGVSGAVYNDALATLLCTTSIGVTASALRRGPRSSTWPAITALACLAGLTRLSLMAVIIPCVSAVAVEGLARGRDRDRWGRLTGPLAAAISGVAVVATSGWFYVRNLRLTGSITGGHPEWSAEHLGRTTRDLGSLATDFSSWSSLLGIFSTGTADPDVVFLLLVLAPCVLGTIWSLSALLHRRVTSRDIAVVVLLGAVSMCVVAMQFKYSSGGGGLIPRYVLPIIAPLAACISAGLTGSRRATPFLVPLWAMAAATLLLSWRRSVTAPDATQFPTLPFAADAATAITLMAAGVATALVVRTSLKPIGTRLTRRIDTA